MKTTTSYAVIEFLRNSAGFETGGMQHHGHHEPAIALQVQAQVQAATGNRVQAALPQEISLD